MAAETKAGFDPERFFAMVRGYGHGDRIGIRYLDHGSDWCDLALDPDPRLVGDPIAGTIATGPVIALMDMATSLAIWIRRNHFTPQATLDLRVDYLRSATRGRTLIGHGECYRLTRRIAFVRGHAHDGDPADPVAHVAGTFMLMGDTEARGGGE